MIKTGNSLNELNTHLLFTVKNHFNPTHRLIVFSNKIKQKQSKKHFINNTITKKRDAGNNRPLYTDMNLKTLALCSFTLKCCFSSLL